jgi:hypothetical protein
MCEGFRFLSAVALFFWYGGLDKLDCGCFVILRIAASLSLK